MVDHLKTCLPEEGCGLLAGAAGVIVDVYPIENIDHSPSAYRMHPEQQVNGIFDIENRGLQLTGFYHSHPKGIAYPSQTDLQQATYPDAVYLIVSFGDNSPRVRAFTLADFEIREHQFEIEM